MKETWSLDELYSGYDDPAYASDLQKLQDSINAINQAPAKLAENDLAANVRMILDLLNNHNRISSKLFSFSSLQVSANTNDGISASKMGVLMQMNNQATKAQTQLQKYIAHIGDIDKFLQENPDLEIYRTFFKRAKDDDQYALSDEVEEAIGKMNISGGNAWNNLQSALTSSVKVQYNGTTTNLSTIRNLAYDPDPAVRKAAYEAELACYDQIKVPVAYALNSIKMQAASECQLRGYDSVLSKTLHTSRMKPETLDALWSAIDDYLPKFHEYLAVKGKALGHENGCPWYDMFAPMGKNDKTYTIEEAKDYLMELFESFNPQLAEIAGRAFDENWIDYYPREGKVGGAFCSGLGSIKQFRILTNFDGMFTDLVTIAHELGHGYHNFMVHDNPPVIQRYTMPVAETASTFNENVVMNAAIARAESKEEKLALIESQLSDTTQIICDIYSRFLFEKEVCERRVSEFLSADELCDIMIRSQKKAYGHGLDNDVLHPYMWICKSHYYRANLGYYNFPYAFGGLFARGLYEQYLKEGTPFIEKFNKMLKATPTTSCEDAAMICGIDLTDKAFWSMSLEAVTKNIEIFKDLVK